MVGAPASYLKLEELSGSPLCTDHHLGKGVAPQGLTRVQTGGCCRQGDTGMGADPAPEPWPALLLSVLPRNGGREQ